MALAAFIISLVSALIAAGSVWYTRRSSDTSRRAHADGLGTAVTLKMLEPSSTRRVRSAGQRDAPRVAASPMELRWPGDSGTEIYLLCDLNVVNDSDRTVTIRSTHGALLGSWGPMVSVNGAGLSDPGLIDELTVAAESAEHLVAMIRFDLHKWVGDDKPLGDQTVTTTLLASGLEEGSGQAWDLTMTAQIVQGDPLDSGVIRLEAFTMPKVRCREQPRRYPWNKNEHSSDKTPA